MKELAILKKYILESKNIDETINYFFGLIEQNENISFLNQRKINSIGEHPELEMAISAVFHVVSQMLDRPVAMVNSMFLEVIHERFYHGYCNLVDYPVPLLVLYCADFQSGVAVLSTSSGEVEYFRFSVTMVQDSCKIH